MTNDELEALGPVTDAEVIQKLTGLSGLLVEIGSNPRGQKLYRFHHPGDGLLHTCTKYYEAWTFARGVQFGRAAERSQAWTLWEDGENGEAFVKGTKPLPNEVKSYPKLKLVKTFYAPSYNDAMRQYYEYRGWAPYKPMCDAQGNEYPDPCEGTP